MTFQIRRVRYYSVCVPAEPSEACSLLGRFAELGINMLAFSAVPIGEGRTQLYVFPEDDGQLESVSRKAGIDLDGPHGALLVQGVDEMGALARVHGELQRAGVQVYASSAVSDGRGGFGYVIHMRAEQEEHAAKVLGV